MKHLYRIMIAGLLLLMLVLIRVLEDLIFTEPTMDFFKNIYDHIQHPERIPQKVYWNIALRYWINSIISMAIIFVAFQNKGFVRFAAVIYAIFFAILLPLFILMIPDLKPGEYQEIYYVRRFLIHPVLILILLPAFYYQKLKNQAQK